MGGGEGDRICVFPTRLSCFARSTAPPETADGGGGGWGLDERFKDSRRRPRINEKPRPIFREPSETRWVDNVEGGRGQQRETQAFYVSLKNGGQSFLFFPVSLGHAMNLSSPGPPPRHLGVRDTETEPQT